MENTIEMKFTPEQIAELPTLEDVILNFADLTVNHQCSVR